MKLVAYPLITMRPEGMYCAAGDFFIDPWRGVDRAVLTHAHADHARRGSKSYLAARDGVTLLRKRLGEDVSIEGASYGAPISIGNVTVTLFPAGHVLGSSQVLVEHRGERWVVTGDFKRALDPTCAPFEVVRCHTLITEATFALPVFRWPTSDQVADEIFAWWEACRDADKPALLYVYALGKAQRVLAELAKRTDRPVFAHGAVHALNQRYAAEGIRMLPSRLVSTADTGYDFRGDLVLAPPGARGSVWTRKFKRHSAGFASGWMRVRGNRRRRGYDRGFVLSDHADWPALLRTVDESEAERVVATHGSADTLARYLTERGIEARTFQTEFDPMGEAADALDMEESS